MEWKLMSARIVSGGKVTPLTREAFDSCFSGKAAATTVTPPLSSESDGSLLID